MQSQDCGEAHGRDADHRAEDGDRLADPESHEPGMAPQTDIFIRRRRARVGQFFSFTTWTFEAVSGAFSLTVIPKKYIRSMAAPNHPALNSGERRLASAVADERTCRDSPTKRLRSGSTSRRMPPRSVAT